MFTKRKNIPRGPFWMGQTGFMINAIALVLIIFFNVLFCFPYTLPVAKATMNYNSVILMGTIALTAFWWFVHGLRKYPGPRVAEFIHADSTDLSKV